MKRLAIAILLLIASMWNGANADVFGVTGKVTPVLSAATTTVTSNSYQFTNQAAQLYRAHKANVTAGSGTATVLVEVTDNLAYPWVTACTLNLASASTTADSCITSAPWPYVRHRISAISGITVYSTISQ